VIVGGDEPAIRVALDALLGVEVELRQVERLIDLGEGKPRRYRSAVPD
jgi:phenylacetate-CoA ligase